MSGIYPFSLRNEKSKKLTLPYYPYSQNSTGNKYHYQYEVVSFWRQLVSDYTGLDFVQIGDLNFLQFLIWRRDAYIRRLEQTEAGREYLENAYRMEQTGLDRAKLRKKLNKE